MGVDSAMNQSRSCSRAQAGRGNDKAETVAVGLLQTLRFQTHHQEAYSVYDEVTETGSHLDSESFITPDGRVLTFLHLVALFVQH